MACAITKGRTLPCKNSVGGLKNVYILDYGSAVANVTPSSGTVTLPTDGTAEFGHRDLLERQREILGRALVSGSAPDD